MNESRLCRSLSRANKQKRKTKQKETTELTRRSWSVCVRVIDCADSPILQLFLPMSQPARSNEAAATRDRIKAAIAENHAADAAQGQAELAVNAAIAREKANPTDAAAAEVKAAMDIYEARLQDY